MNTTTPTAGFSVPPFTPGSTSTASTTYTFRPITTRSTAHLEPPRENIYRAIRPGYELRASDDEQAPPTLTGHFAVFNQWTEINSIWEGNFLERLAPGSFRKTFQENRDGMRVLFQHGADPVIGDKPLGPIDELREDKTGAYYEVPLLDTSYNRDLLPGLEAGLYGASFRFRVMREELVEEPGQSAWNPKGLPERTIREAQVMEFGPVTFPAYAGATAGVRSITDELILSRARQVVARFDNEGVGCLAQMIALGSDFIADSDEPGEESKVTTMQGVIDTLASLLQGETVEVEPDEPEDEAGGRSAATAPSQPDAAPAGTSSRSAAPLYTTNRKEEPSWRL